MNKKTKLIILGIMGIILLGLMQYNRVLVFDDLVPEAFDMSKLQEVNVVTLEPGSKKSITNIATSELEMMGEFFEANDYKRSYKSIKVEEIETQLPFYIEFIMDEKEVLTIYSHGMVSYNRKNYRLYFEGYNKANESQDALTALYQLLLEE